MSLGLKERIHSELSPFFTYAVVGNPSMNLSH
jgi:hypothetical protein